MNKLATSAVLILILVGAGAFLYKNSKDDKEATGLAMFKIGVSVN